MTSVAPRSKAVEVADRDSVKWAGPTRRYDLVKEFVAALLAVTLVTALLAGIFSSPDVKEVTLAGWANAAPNDFVATAATELDGTSGSAGYGAPYTHDASAAQKIGPLSPQNWPGVTIPIDAATDFVIRPLKGVARPALRSRQRSPPGRQPRPGNDRRGPRRTTMP